MRVPARSRTSAPGPELIVGGGCRRWLGVEDVPRILLEQRIDGAAGADVAGFGRSWPVGEDVNLVEVEQALCSPRRGDAAFHVPVGTGDPARVRGPVRLQRGGDVGLTGAWCPVPGVPLVAAQGRERAAVQLQLVLGQQVLLEESGICGQRKSARVCSSTSRTGGLVRAGRIPALAVRRSSPISRSRRSSSRSSTLTCATRSERHHLQWSDLTYEISSAHASDFTSHVCDGPADGQGVGMIPAQDPNQIGEQLLKHAQGLRAVSALVGPECDVAAGAQGVGVVWA
jgi:hypothetical protein